MGQPEHIHPKRAKKKVYTSKTLPCEYSQEFIQIGVLSNRMSICRQKMHNLFLLHALCAFQSLLTRRISQGFCTHVKYVAADSVATYRMN